MNTQTIAKHLAMYTSDAAFDAAERCYAAMFSTQEVEIVDEDLAEELNGYALSKAAANIKDEAAFERFEDEFIPPFKIGDRVVMLVNYKGEGEQYVHAEAAARLPLFKSKHESFMHFGA